MTRTDSSNISVTLILTVTGGYQGGQCEDFGVKPAANYTYLVPSKKLASFNIISHQKDGFENAQY